MSDTMLNKRKILAFATGLWVNPLALTHSEKPKRWYHCRFFFHSRIFYIKCLGPLWINFLQFGAFLKRGFGRISLSSLSPHVRFWNRQTTESQPILQSGYSRKLLSWSCIIHFSDIPETFSPPPFFFPQGRNIAMLWVLFQHFEEKKNNTSLPWALISLFFWLTTRSLHPRGETFLQNTLSFLFLTLTHSWCIWASPSKSICDRFTYSQLHRLHFVMLSVGSGNHFWVLVFSNLMNYLQLILTQPLIGSTSSSRGQIRLLDYLGTESSDGHTALALPQSCPSGQCCNYPHFPAAVSSLLKAGLDCLRSRIQFAVPPVTCCDSFGDKSGLNWVQVSLLWDRREV